MDLDNIKNIWDSENPDITPEISFEKQKELHFPLEKLRKNMRMEFYSTIVALFFIIIFFSLEGFDSLKFQIYSITLVGSIILVTVFYFYQFFILYKNLSNVDLNLLDNLKELKFQFKLNQQYYLSYYIAYVPFSVAEVLLIFEFFPVFKSLTGLMFIGCFLLFCVLMLGALYLGGKWWFNRYYGKYFNQIINLINDLK